MGSGNRKKFTILGIIINRIQHRLIIQVIRNQLARIGIEITPFYLVQNGAYITEIPKIKGDEDDYSCGFLDEEDIRNIEYEGRGYAIEKLLSYLQTGKKCYGIKKGNQVAAFVWIDFEECNFKPKRFTLQKNEAYLFDAYTMESLRGMNIAPYMAYHCYNDLKALGRNTLYSISEYFNHSAIKYKKKLGAKNLELYLYLGLFNRFNRLFLLRSYA